MSMARSSASRVSQGGICGLLKQCNPSHGCIVGGDQQTGLRVGQSFLSYDPFNGLPQLGGRVLGPEQVPVEAGQPPVKPAGAGRFGDRDPGTIQGSARERRSLVLHARWVRTPIARKWLVSQGF